MEDSNSLLDPKIQEAISAALENNWPKALEFNQKLLKKYPKDIDIMNRLAKAYSEVGKAHEAKKLYQTILKLDPYNQIADKNLKRIFALKKGVPTEINKTVANLKGDIFLEEPGKAIIVNLSDLAMLGVLANLQIGDKLELAPHRNVITAITADGRRIGKINGTLAAKIAENIRAGSKFESFIKSISLREKSKKENSQVSIFIRETMRSPKVIEAPFATKPIDFTPYVREEALPPLSEQAPLPTEADDSIEEVEVANLPSVAGNESLEDLAEKEAEDSDHLEKE